MLTQVSMRSAKLGQTGKTLEQTDEKAAAVAERLGALLAQVDGLEARAKAFDAVEQRVAAMLETAESAQEAGAKLLGRLTVLQGAVDEAEGRLGEREKVVAAVRAQVEGIHAWRGSSS